MKKKSKQNKAKTFNSEIKLKKQGTAWIKAKIEDKMKRNLKLKMTTMTIMEIQTEKRLAKLSFLFNFASFWMQMWFTMWGNNFCLFCFVTVNLWIKQYLTLNLEFLVNVFLTSWFSFKKPSTVFRYLFCLIYFCWVKIEKSWTWSKISLYSKVLLQMTWWRFTAITSFSTR